VSSSTRSSARLENATTCASAEIAGGSKLGPSPTTPVQSVETTVVDPLPRSWRKTSVSPFVSFGTRSVAPLTNTTTLPSADKAGDSLYSLLWLPAESTLSRVNVPVVRSSTNTSSKPLLS
jgi:hypothetical protein